MNTTEHGACADMTYEELEALLEANWSPPKPKHTGPGAVWGTEFWGEVSRVCVVLEERGENSWLFAPVFDDIALAAEGDEIARYRNPDGSDGKACVVAHALARECRPPQEKVCGGGGRGIADETVILDGERCKGPSSPEALEHRKKLDVDLACFLGQAEWVQWPTEEELRRKEELAIWKAGLRAKRLAREAEEAAAAQEGEQLRQPSGAAPGRQGPGGSFHPRAQDQELHEA